MTEHTHRIEALSSPVAQRASVFRHALIALGASVLFAGSAMAQSHAPEAAPQLGSQPQAKAEMKKAAKPQGVAPIKDGGTARGEGSGLRQTSKAEAAGQQKAAAREAMPHTEAGQGGTPK